MRYSIDPPVVLPRPNVVVEFTPEEAQAVYEGLRQGHRHVGGGYVWGDVPKLAELRWALISGVKADLQNVSNDLAGRSTW